jgi:ADP-L-glycero-D-manno-heptose 6-epimerase
MIVVTGASGFIGSALVGRLNEIGFKRDVIVVDDFYKDYKDNNLKDKEIRDWVHRDLFLDWFKKSGNQVTFVFHLGARTDTVEQDVDIFNKLNLDYSKRIWQICADKGIQMVYASSAATYGSGDKGYDDADSITPTLEALNPYGDSKLHFDQWVLNQKDAPSKWAGLRFFNVYGANEYHKNRMASVVFHAYHQIKNTGGMKLFKSHKKGIENGHQSRDFVYIKDVLNVLQYLLENTNINSGIYNLGSGKASTFLDLTKATFKAMEVDENISFIDTPLDIREAYQYFTEAKLDKLRSTGFTGKFTSLEEGIEDYVQNYMKTNTYL